MAISAVRRAKLLELEIKRQEFWKREKADPEQEKLLYSSVRLFSKDDYLDSITVCRKLVENVGGLMECIEVISGGRSFWNPSSAKEGAANRNSRGAASEPAKKPQCPTIHDKFPHWFSASEGGTIYEWLCAFLEETIVHKYFYCHFLGIISIILNLTLFPRPLPSSITSFPFGTTLRPTPKPR